MNTRLLLAFTVALASGLLSACGGGANSAIPGGVSSQPNQVSNGGQSAVTPSTAVTTTWVVGGGFPFKGVDIAQAANGDRVLMRATGTFSAGTISGGGKYTIENANGSIHGHGTFTATTFVSFVSYGFVPGTSLEGGTLVAGVHLVSAAGGVADGTLTVNCALGSPPPGVDEGIKLAVNGGTNYDESIHGNTVFIAQ